MGQTRSLNPSNFDGAGLDQMRGWVNGGSGADAVRQKAEHWRSEETYMRELAERTKQRLKKANAVTQSRGGEAMQNAMAPVVLWTEVSAENARAEAERLEEQGDSFSRVKASIPDESEEKPVPEENFLGQAWATVTGGKTDNEQALAHNEKLRQEAVTAFSNYDNASQTNVTATPTFTEPPKAGIETGVTSGQGGTGAGAGGGGYAGGPGSGGYPGAGGGTGGRSSWSGSLDPAGSGATETTQPAGSQSSWATPPGTPTGYPQAQAPTTGGGPGNTGGGYGAGGALGGRFAGGGLGGSGGGTGAGYGGRGAGGRLGAGGQSGLGRTAPTTGPTSAASGTSASNSAGRGMMGGAGRGAGQQSDEDEEHETPSYLVGDYGYFDDDVPKVAPPVIGEN